MRNIMNGIVLAAVLAGSGFSAEPVAGPINNVIVYFEPERYCGWPANNGIWSWGNEIVVGFALGFYKDEGSSHPVDGSRPQVMRFARSHDGGQTWKLEVPSFLDAEGNEKTPVACPGGLDFTATDSVLMFRMKNSTSGYSHFYQSTDRAKTWQGPYQLPTFDRKGIFARTDYLVNGKHDVTAFLTAAKDGGGEGWPFWTRTTDGGKTWSFGAWIGEQPGDGGYAIMPSTLRLSEQELFTYIRVRGVVAGKKEWWIEPYRSLDKGQTWKLEKENAINNAGNPPFLTQLKDGRLALTYGHRLPPYGIRARLSSDHGRTWTPDIMLRDDGDSWDLGYVRTVLRPDGKLVTVYYFNDESRKERYIAATIWDPGKAYSAVRGKVVK